MTTPTLREAAPTDAQLDALWSDACQRDQPTRDMVRAFARAAIAAAHPQQPARVPLTGELPDSIRVPLHRLWADAGYLVGRAKTGNTDLAVHTIRALCDEVERAIRAAGIVPAPTTDKEQQR
jgi:hypothetical protein